MIEELLHPLVCGRFKTDPHYREGHLRIINALPGRLVLGLHAPEMKQIAKQISKHGCQVALPTGEYKICKDGRQVISCFEAVPEKSLCYEETVIWGFLINLQKSPLERSFEMLSHYVPVLDNWAVCDSFCAHAKWMKHAGSTVRTRTQIIQTQITFAAHCHTQCTMTEHLNTNQFTLRTADIFS